jgi:hypothetical protein
MLYFCTYLDSNYLSRGLALYYSLSRYSPPFRLWVLCFDDLAYKVLRKLALPEVVPLRLSEFEEGDSELLQAKNNRSKIEYYFTCTPSLLLYILRNYPEVDIITYLDADLFFFSDPTPIYQEFGEKSILIVGHRFPPHLKKLEIHGIYNVGLLSFRRDSEGLRCLNWWRHKCLEWCYDRVESNRFADQKYLDDWPTRFSQVVVLQHKGANLAPWNMANYCIWLKNNQVMVDEFPLIFFHFHNLRTLSRWIVDPGLSEYSVPMSKVVKNNIFLPYIRKLKSVRTQLHSLNPAIANRYGNPRRGEYNYQTMLKMLLRRKLLITILIL